LARFFHARPAGIGFEEKGALCAAMRECLPGKRAGRFGALQDVRALDER
jgi:hypothetical protein